MRKPGLSLLIIAGLLAVGDLQSVRQFRYVGVAKNWSDAQTYCRKTFSDLATIQNAANVSEARQAAGNSQFWIGLFNGSWRWSQDENAPDATNTLFTYWNPGQPQTGLCVTISKTWVWSTSDCGELNDFLCYSAATSRNIFVSQKMSWSDAQAYCRSFYTDLSSIRSMTDNTAMSNLLPANTINYLNLNLLSYTSTVSTAWIGLHRSDWVWSDGGSSSYMPLGTQSSVELADCVMMDTATGVWSRKPCSQSYAFLCSADVPPLRTKALKIRLNNPGPAELNDRAVQEAVLLQLQQKLKDGGVTEEVKLRWRIGPDGKVFQQQQQQTAPPGVCQGEPCDPV